MINFLLENYQGGPKLTLLNMLNVQNVLKDAWDLACWDTLAENRHLCVCVCTSDRLCVRVYVSVFVYLIVAQSVIV